MYHLEIYFLVTIFVSDNEFMVVDCWGNVTDIGTDTGIITGDTGIPDIVVVLLTVLPTGFVGYVVGI